MRLASRLFHLGSALAYFEFRVTFANHVDSASALNHLAIRVAVLQGTDAADNFHRIVQLNSIVSVKPASRSC